MGALTLGRQLNTLAETLGVVDPLAARGSSTNMSLRFGYLGGPGNTIAEHFGPNPGVAGANPDRVDNALKYSVTSAATGLLATAMVAAGEGTGGGRAAGALLGYDGHGVNLRGSFMQYKDASGIAFNACAAGAAYRIGALTLKVSYAQNKIDSALQTEGEALRKPRDPGGRGGRGVDMVEPVGPERRLLPRQAHAGQRGRPGGAEVLPGSGIPAVETNLAGAGGRARALQRRRAALDTGTPLLPGARSSNYLGTAITHAF